MTPEQSQRLKANIQKTLSTHAKNDESFLWMAYWVIFEREADSDGLEGWLNELNNGASRSTVIKKMLEAHEFQQRLPEEHRGQPLVISFPMPNQEKVKAFIPPVEDFPLIPLSIDELKQQVASKHWFHQINLGNGIITPGLDDSAEKLVRVKMPEKLDGMTVLDIGAWNGFFSFEAERRGASRVLATDSYAWHTWDGKSGFDLARRTLNSKVQTLEIDILELSPDKIGTFDLVLCLGVLYHMRHPLLSLEKVFSVTGNQLILETTVELFSEDRPAMVFYPGTEFANDPTNWCGANPAAVIAMLKVAGFTKVELASLVDFPIPNTGRATFHAWR
jgi:tRNA (mo5U34)-methyltransferase